MDLDLDFGNVGGHSLDYSDESRIISEVCNPSPTQNVSGVFQDIPAIGRIPLVMSDKSLETGIINQIGAFIFDRDGEPFYVGECIEVESDVESGGQPWFAKIVAFRRRNDSSTSDEQLHMIEEVKCSWFWHIDDALEECSYLMTDIDRRSYGKYEVLLGIDNGEETEFADWNCVDCIRRKVALLTYEEYRTLPVYPLNVNSPVHFFRQILDAENGSLTPQLPRIVAVSNGEFLIWCKSQGLDPTAVRRRVPNSSVFTTICRDSPPPILALIENPDIRYYRCSCCCWLFTYPEGLSSSLSITGDIDTTGLTKYKPQPCTPYESIVCLDCIKLSPVERLVDPALLVAEQYQRSFYCVSNGAHESDQRTSTDVATPFCGMGTTGTLVQGEAALSSTGGLQRQFDGIDYALNSSGNMTSTSYDLQGESRSCRTSSSGNIHHNAMLNPRNNTDVSLIPISTDFLRTDMRSGSILHTGIDSATGILRGGIDNTTGMVSVGLEDRDGIQTSIWDAQCSGMDTIHTAERKSGLKYQRFAEVLTKAADEIKAVGIKSQIENLIDPETLAHDIVEALDAYCEKNNISRKLAHQKMHERYQNLKRVNNSDLRRRLLTSLMSPTYFVSCDAKELAPECLKRKRKQEASRYFQQQVLLSAGPNKIIRKTHKGLEEVIEDDLTPIFNDNLLNGKIPTRDNDDLKKVSRKKRSSRKQRISESTKPHASSGSSSTSSSDESLSSSSSDDSSVSTSPLSPMTPGQSNIGGHVDVTVDSGIHTDADFEPLVFQPHSELVLPDSGIEKSFRTPLNLEFLKRSFIAQRFIKRLETKLLPTATRDTLTSSLACTTELMDALASLQL